MVMPTSKEKNVSENTEVGWQTIRVNLGKIEGFALDDPLALYRVGRSDT